MNIYITRKKWYKNLSLFLVMTLMIGLMSGCGQKNNNNPADSIDVAAQTKTVHSKSDAIVTKDEELARSMDALEDIISNGETAKANEVVKDIIDIIDTENNDIAEWLEAQNKVSESLSDESKATYNERLATFEASIKEKQEKTSSIIASLTDAINNNEVNNIEAYYNELDEIVLHKDDAAVYSVNGERNYKPLNQEIVSFNYINNELDATDVSYLATAGDAEVDEAIANKADELETPLAIYNYLKNNIGYEYYYGSRKGAKGVLASMNGNDLDQASLLLSMLRYKGYPSVYVRGEIVLTGEQAMALTGADTIQNAANVLISCGNPTTVLARNNVPYSVKMEHVWVRAYIPVGDYRGTGDVSGESAWIDLDTGIKEYEAVDNIYDEFANADIKYSLEDIASVTDSAQLESMSNELLGQLDTSKEIYTKKRIIKKEELLYLPLSLQYEVRKEKGEFVEVDEDYKDKVSLSINGQEFADIYASDVFGKNIIISYEPSTNADKEILDRYGDVFKTPAYAVEMKTVLLIDGEKVAEGEFGDYNTLGEVQNFTMDLYSNNGVTSVDNKLHVGSMYALTLDNGFISGDELQNAYDEVAAIKDALSEDKVYSAKQLGNMLAFAGKLYFSQVDLMDMSFAETYDVAATRTLSEGITGYEAEPIYSYGMVRGLDYGKLYIDVDTDAHCVKSLTGKTEDETEYMINSGINSSINESLVWEEITGEQSISTMSILETAEEQGIEIEMIAPRNLDEKLALLDVDDAVKDAVVKNVNAGNIVTIPRENVLIGEWYGTGYISLNPETGEGEYIISGGLSGGSSSGDVVAAAMVTYGLSVIDMIEAMLMIVEAVKLIALGSALATAGSVVFAGLAIFSIISTMVLTVQTSLLIMAYAEGDDKAAEKIINEMWLNLALTIGTAILGSIAKKAFKSLAKSKLARRLGEGLANNLIDEFGDIEKVNKYLKSLEKLGVDDDVLKQYAYANKKAGLEALEKIYKSGFGKDTAESLLKYAKNSKSGWNKIPDILDVLKANSSRADDIMDLVLKHGDDALDVVRKYGDDGIDLLRKHGDDALDVAKKYGDDAVDIYRRYGDNGIKYANKYGDDAVNAIRKYGDTAYNAIDKYGDDAVDALKKYGDDAADGFKNGKTPGEIKDVHYSRGTLIGKLDGLTADERTMVEDLLASGKNVEIIPRSNVSNVKTPDFLVDGVKTELKTLNGSSLNTPVTRIQDGFAQGAETVIIDGRKTEITLEDANVVMQRVIGIYGGELPGKVEIWTKDGILRR